jgi:O-glycosyl hydrolase
MNEWRDVENADSSEEVSPFAMGAVDRLAYIDDDSAVELRGGDIYANIPKPEIREKPQARVAQREKKWSTEFVPPKQTSDKREFILTGIQIVLILAISGALALTVWTLVSSYKEITTETHLGGTTNSENYQVAQQDPEA